MKLDSIKKILEDASDRTSISYLGKSVRYPSLANLRNITLKENIISSHLDELLNIVFKAHQCIKDMDPLFKSTEELKQAFEALELKGE